jgi:hypothetical protein
MQVVRFADNGSQYNILTRRCDSRRRLLECPTHVGVETSQCSIDNVVSVRRIGPLISSVEGLQKMSAEFLLPYLGYLTYRPLGRLRYLTSEGLPSDLTKAS